MSLWGATNKTKWAQLKKIGPLALAAPIVLGIFLMIAARGFFTSKSSVYIFLDDSAVITVPEKVSVNGINVGQVSQVSKVDLSLRFLLPCS